MPVPTNRVRSILIVVLIVGMGLTELFLLSSLQREKKSSEGVRRDLTAAQQDLQAMESKLHNLADEKKELENILVRLRTSANESETQLQTISSKLEGALLELSSLQGRYKTLLEGRRDLAGRLGKRGRAVRQTLSKLRMKIETQKSQIDLGSIVVPKPAEPEVVKPKPVFEVKDKNSVQVRVVAVNPEYSFVVVETDKRKFFNPRQTLAVLTEAGDEQQAQVETIDNNLVVLNLHGLALQPQDRLILTRR